MKVVDLAQFLSMTLCCLLSKQVIPFIHGYPQNFAGGKVMNILDNEYEKLLTLLEHTGCVLRKLKYQFRQQCTSEYVKGATIIELYNKIEYNQREFERLDDMLTELERAF